MGFGATTDVGLVGDVNGDGISDLVLYRNGIWYASTHQVAMVDLTFGLGGAPGDIPLLCDFDGDGTADLVIFRAGTWYVSTQRNGIVDKVFHFGQAGDVPLCGDFNADGIADLALFRNGVWYIDTHRAGAVDMVIGFGGVAGEIPVALDFDGDGRTDIGVFRNGVWYINTTLDGASAVVVGYGAPGDVPLAGYFNRANTRFVRAGSACLTGCTQANPYGTITAAWQDAIDGDILRIAKGTYPESLVFSYPGNQYMPGKFGKNNIKLIGVSKYTTIVAPPSGDAMYLAGASGYVLRGLKLTSQARGRARARARGRDQLGAAVVSRGAGQRAADRHHGQSQHQRAPHGIVERVVQVRAAQPAAARAMGCPGGDKPTSASSRARSATTGIWSRPPCRRRIRAKGSTSATTPKATPAAARCTGTSPSASCRCSGPSCASRRTRSTAPAPSASSSARRGSRPTPASSR